MEFLPIIYLGYMFISIYFLSFFLLLFFKNRKSLFEIPQLTKKYSLSVLVPAFNEEKTIENTINTIFSSSYPLLEVIVLNDGSTDKTQQILEDLKKKYKRLKVLNKENSGKADSLNQGLKIVKGELVAVVDADSYPDENSFEQLVGFFDDEKVGVATPFILPRNKKSFFEKMQVIEYNVIAFTRKLLGFVEAIYVTPGPLALYRKSALQYIGGFDVNNITEDIEATWNLTKNGYKRKMCLFAKASTTTPNKFRAWFKQRRRWSLGGIQCIAKYKKYFFKKGMLGFFILPFFVLQLFLGLLGLSIFVYLTTTRLLRNYLFVKYSVRIGTPLLTMNDVYITPSFLNYLGIVLFVFGFIFTILVLAVMKEEILSKHNFFNLLFYSVFYLSVYPFIMLPAIYNYIKGKNIWR